MLVSCSALIEPQQELLATGSPYNLCKNRVIVFFSKIVNNITFLSVAMYIEI